MLALPKQGIFAANSISDKVSVYKMLVVTLKSEDIVAANSFSDKVSDNNDQGKI